MGQSAILAPRQLPIANHAIVFSQVSGKQPLRLIQMIPLPNHYELCRLSGRQRGLAALCLRTIMLKRIGPLEESGKGSGSMEIVR
jgi:hypothetical protein